MTHGSVDTGTLAVRPAITCRYSYHNDESLCIFYKDLGTGFFFLPMNLVAADISRRTLNPGEDDADSCRLRFRGSRREVSFRQILSLRPSSGPGCGCAVISSSVSARGQNSLHSFVAKESVLISEIRVRFFQLLASLFSPLPPVHPPLLSVKSVKSVVARFDCSFAALVHPWLKLYASFCGQRFRVHP